METIVIDKYPYIPLSSLNKIKSMENAWIGNPFMNYVEYLLFTNKKWQTTNLFWDANYPSAEDSRGINVAYYQNIDYLKHNPFIKKSFRYLVNVDTNEYIDLKKIDPIEVSFENGKSYPMIPHPLPYLIYIDNDMILGEWAFTRVIPKLSIPKNMIEIHYIFSI